MDDSFEEALKRKRHRRGAKAARPQPRRREAKERLLTADELTHPGRRRGTPALVWMILGAGATLLAVSAWFIVPIVSKERNVVRYNSIVHWWKGEYREVMAEIDKIDVGDDNYPDGVNYIGSQVANRIELAHRAYVRGEDMGPILDLLEGDRREWRHIVRSYNRRARKH